MINAGRKIVISGTYSAGKSTTAVELSKRIGLPLAVARGMRDILPEAFPGKRLEDCTPFEIVQLGNMRFGERTARESSLGIGYISDGSVLHEWAYGEGRRVVGANGPGSEIRDPGYGFAIGAFGEVVKRYAKNEYTDVIHLPVEFPLSQDGHRPVSEDFRAHADRLILDTWKSLGKNVHVIGGPTIENRVDKIIQALGLISSHTLNSPLSADGQIGYDRIEDMLGPQEGRYFSNGFRKSHHFINDVRINPTIGTVEARLDVSTPDEWSMKNGKVCEKHFTSVDSILVTGQLLQALMYTQDNITRESSNNLWLRDLRVTPGRRAITSLEDVPLKLAQQRSKYLKMGGDDWHLNESECQIGDPGVGFKVWASVGYKMPKKVE